MSWLTSRYTVTADPLMTERRVELVVVALVALLGLQLLLGVFGLVFPSEPEPVMPTPESLQVGSVDDREPVTAAQRDEMRQRPLFWSSRRASAQTEAYADTAEIDSQSQKKPVKISGVKLSGVFGAGDSAGIIVLAKDKKRRVMVGEELNGWTLESVTPVEAVFSKTGQQSKLTLARGKLVMTQSPPVQQEMESSKSGKKNKAGAKAPKPAIPEPLGLGRSDRGR